jgi:hypothetical protein
MPENEELKIVEGMSEFVVDIDNRDGMLENMLHVLAPFQGQKVILTARPLLPGEMVALEIN